MVYCSDETARLNVKWTEFVKAVKAYYKPIENQTLKHIHFRTVNQLPDENFPRFCNRVEAEAKHFRSCNDENCNGKATAIKDQILIGKPIVTFMMKRSNNYGD